jgi:hypothetical protein
MNKKPSSSFILAAVLALSALPAAAQCDVGRETYGHKDADQMPASSAPAATATSAWDWVDAKKLYESLARTDRPASEFTGSWKRVGEVGANAVGAVNLGGYLTDSALGGFTVAPAPEGNPFLTRPSVSVKGLVGTANAYADGGAWTFNPAQTGLWTCRFVDADNLLCLRVLVGAEDRLAAFAREKK